MSPKLRMLVYFIVVLFVLFISIPLTGNLIVALMYTNRQVATLGEWRWEQGGKYIRFAWDGTYLKGSTRADGSKEQNGQYAWFDREGKRFLVLDSDTCDVDPDRGPMFFSPDVRGRPNGYEHHMPNQVWGFGLFGNSLLFVLFLSSLFLREKKPQPQPPIE